MARDYQGNYGARFGLDDPRSGKAAFDRPFLDLVRKADPEFDKLRKSELEYRFSNERKFRADPAKRGPYAG